MPRRINDWEGRAIIIDLRPIIREIDSDKGLWIVRDALETKEIVESLLNEEWLPREYPAIMDIISDYVDKRPDIQNVISDDALDVLSIRLQSYQYRIDGIIQDFVTEPEYSYRYEVVRWLGDSGAIIAINSTTKRTIR